jgi:ABC-type multidrug transport system ATPase subunit
MTVRCSGLAKPGEMILVLGCPGSGCTTFLKAIANERGKYSSVAGEVCYAGIDFVEMRETYKGETVYNPDGAKNTPSCT